MNDRSQQSTRSDPVCEPGTAFANAIESVRRGEQTVEQATLSLLKQLTDSELLWLLDGDLPTFGGILEMGRKGYNSTPIEAGRLDRLGIPGIRFTDGPRGVVMGHSTAFPAAIGRAATFDTELEEAVGDAIGAEASAQGANFFAGICINLAYSPGWGRAQESYGEDPLLLGAMGAALTRGVNSWVMSCVKHFALNSMEIARFRVNVHVEEDVLHEVFLPHFRTVVEAGADAVMSSYNSVNGTWAGENRHLLTEILRDQWGFRGFVMTDFIWGLRHPVESVIAGQDLEMPFRQQRVAALPRALQEGTLSRADVERAAGRILAAQLRLSLRARPTPAIDVVGSPQHRELARNTSRKSLVLLRNEQIDGSPMLPLNAESPRKVVVLGRLADQENLGDTGSSKVHPPARVTILQGLRERLGDRVEHVDSAQMARGANAAVVVVGLSSADEGEFMINADIEAMQLLGGILRWRPMAAAVCALVRFAGRSKKLGGGDRHDLRLRPEDVALIQSVSAVNPHTVVVVIGGGTVVLDPWDANVAALLLAWYPGMEGGRAVADVLFGDAEPGGRLPFAIPKKQSDLPQVDWQASRVAYDRWWGQRKLDREGVAAAYPFGYGLGYTTFSLDEVEAGPIEGERFDVHVKLTNIGKRTGRHVIQVYACDPRYTERKIRVLVGFRSVEVEAGTSQLVTVDCSIRAIQRWTPEGFVTEAPEVEIEAASYSGDPSALKTTLRLTERAATNEAVM